MKIIYLLLIFQLDHESYYIREQTTINIINSLDPAKYPNEISKSQYDPNLEVALRAKYIVLIWKIKRHEWAIETVDYNYQNEFPCIDMFYLTSYQTTVSKNVILEFCRPISREYSYQFYSDCEYQGQSWTTFRNATRNMCITMIEVGVPVDFLNILINWMWSREHDLKIKLYD